MIVGDGRNSLWRDLWLNGQCLSNLALDLVKAVQAQLRKRRTVAEALTNNAWVHHIRGSLTVQVLTQYVETMQRLQVWPLMSRYL
jgi:hypothetical protein